MPEKKQKKTSIYMSDALTALLKTRQGHLGRSESIRVHLERYDLLLRQTIREVKLSTEEWHLILDACNGWAAWSDSRSPYYVAAEVEDHVRLNRADEQHGCNGGMLIKKMAAMTTAQRYAVVDFCERWWTADDNAKPEIPVG